MQRRTFNKALASLLTVPLLNLQPLTIDRHKLLSMFLGESWQRYDLSRPYILDGFSYATDARVMARITTSDDESLDETIKIPPLQNVWDTAFKPERQWERFHLHDIKDLVLSPIYNICPVCDDRRVSYGKEYPADEDTALALPDYDPDDNTIRDVSCELCHGRNYEGPSLQPIAGKKIAYRYAKKLAAIPGCEVSVSAGHGYTNGHQTILFRSDVGIGGILMPVR